VIPRYSEPRTWDGVQFPDEGWPGPPQLARAVQLSADQIRMLVEQLLSNFR
jgi:hypothetical protein